MRKFLAYLVPVIISLAGMELGCWGLAKSNLIHMPVPSYSTGQRGRSLAGSQNFWADISPHWGVWHSPGAVLEHQKSCFSAVYRANSHGMRDPERQKQSDASRIAIIGDSMIEGYGLDDDKRLTALLEESNTGTEVLNFGTSGDFGPTQYYLLYKHFVKQFSHDIVVIGMLPANDFRDDDFEFGRRVYRDRYRPYWVGKSPDFELVYHRPNLEGNETAVADTSLQNDSSLIDDLKSLLRTYTYTYNALSYVRRVLILNESAVDSFFFEYSGDQLLRAQHSFTRIAEEAGERPVILMLIPLEQDLIRQQGSSGPSPLARDMQKFADDNGIMLLDLLAPMAAMAKSPSEFYFECDGHWNARGNRVAHELLNRFLFEHRLR